VIGDADLAGLLNNCVNRWKMAAPSRVFSITGSVGVCLTATQCHFHAGVGLWGDKQSNGYCIFE